MDAFSRADGPRWQSPLGNEKLVQLVRSTLDTHARSVDRAAIERRFGTGAPSDVAERCMRGAVRDAAALGATTGIGVSAVELLDVATFGASIAAAVPLVVADLVGVTRIQLCAAYDLSVIHGARLDPADADDCQFALLTAIGAHPSEALTDEGAALVPDALAHRPRRLVRGGLRRALSSGLHGAGRPWVLKRVTERVLLGLVPGVNIPVAAALNGYFTRRVLSAASALMMRRAAIAGPLARVIDAGGDAHAAIGAVVCTLEAPYRDAPRAGWTDDELATLQMAVALSRLTDVDAAALDPYFEHDATFVAAQLRGWPSAARHALRDLLRVVAAASTSAATRSYDSTIAVLVGSESMDETAGLGHTPS